MKVPAALLHVEHAETAALYTAFLTFRPGQWRVPQPCQPGPPERARERCTTPLQPAMAWEDQCLSGLGIRANGTSEHEKLEFWVRAQKCWQPALQVWTAHLSTISGDHERKLAAVATTKVLSDLLSGD